MYDVPLELRKRWLPFQNNSGTEAPPYGCLKITEITDGILQAIRPDSGRGIYAFNGPQAVPAGGTAGPDSVTRGLCSQDYPAFALYDSADGTPANGEIWGPGTDTFKLKKGKPGFLIVGGVDATNKVVTVTPPGILS